MSNTTPVTDALVIVFGSTSLLFAAHHTYKFDKWRCLIPTKKDWFRVMLTWMLILSNMSIFAWGCGWAVPKYKLGYISIPGYAPMPVPWQFWPAKYANYNTPLEILLNLSYSLQASLNAEEALYWAHLMRAIRQPKSASSWLNSRYFYAWIVITVVSSTVQCTSGWVHNNDITLGLARGLISGGAIEVLVLASATAVIFKFPKFLQDVRASGAGPEVRSRLHFYHGNKIRTFFRMTFTVTCLLLGIDGVTTKQLLNTTPIAADILTQVCLVSFFLVLMISMVLYLPRNYSNAPRDPHIMVGRQASRPAVKDQAASGHALMSLLREGGQWDDDDDLRAGLTKHDSMPFAKPNDWSTGSKAMDDQHWDNPNGEVPSLPIALENFTSPIGIQRVEPPKAGPMRIRVEQEVYQHEEV